MSRYTIKRRTLLKGLLGGTAVSVGLPTLEVDAQSQRDGAGPGRRPAARLGLFFWGNGVRLKFWNPAAQGPGWALSPALEPLAPVKEYLNVVSGMDIKIPNSQGHHTGEVGILSGYPLRVAAQGRAPPSARPSARPASIRWRRPSWARPPASARWRWASPAG